MKHFIKSKKGLVLLATLVVAAAAAVGAYAYFSSTGHGTGSATVGTSTDFTVTSDAAVGGFLYPGAGQDTIAYRVHNPGSGHQKLNNVNIKIADSSGNPWSSQTDNTKPACSATDFQLSLDGSTWAPVGGSVDDTALANDLAPTATTGDSTVYIRMVNGAGNQDNCKNAVVPLYFFAS